MILKRITKVSTSLRVRLWFVFLWFNKNVSQPVCVCLYTHTAWGSLNLPTCWIWYMRSPPLMYSMTKYKRSWRENGFTKTGETLPRNDSEAYIQKNQKIVQRLEQWAILERIVGQIEKKMRSENELTVVVCVSINLQLEEYSKFNLRPNSPPLSTEIANMVR